MSPSLPADPADSEDLPEPRHQPLTEGPGEDEGLVVVAALSEDELLPQPPRPSGLPVRRVHPFIRAWKRIGGGSLAFSILIHLGILAAGAVVVFTTVQPADPPDFLPASGSPGAAAASSQLTHQIQQKKRQAQTRTLPRQRLTTASLDSAFTLPESPPDLLSLPSAASLLPGGGAIGRGTAGLNTASFGLGSPNSGLSGITFKPVTMFGLDLKDTRRIAVVMDVSRSMTKYLPAVVSELDKIARQSRLVLYFGCGLTEPKDSIDDRVRRTSGDEFARFWQNWQGKAAINMPVKERRKLIYDPAKPMPLEDIYNRLAGRPNTYFIDYVGIAHTQSALTCREVAEADTVYWFADFQDAVAEKVMAQVARRLKTRRQKIVMHASQRGRSFEKVRDQLVLPLGGSVVEAKVPVKK